HVIRNAGGSVTEDTLRSLVISQWLLGTTEIILVHHTGCGMLGFTDGDLADRIEGVTGERPTFPLGSFEDLEGDIREGIARITASPLVPHKNVRGFVYDVADGRLSEVAP
ncbi:MAG: beta-class carbonic anhydrase, partial [Actinomycetota bacterium]